MSSILRYGDFNAAAVRDENKNEAQSQVKVTMPMNLTLTFDNMGALLAVSLLRGHKKFKSRLEYMRCQQFHRYLVVLFFTEQLDNLGFCYPVKIKIKSYLWPFVRYTEALLS